jgi:hypothetical protein
MLQKTTSLFVQSINDEKEGYDSFRSLTTTGGDRALSFHPLMSPFREREHPAWLRWSRFRFRKKSVPEEIVDKPSYANFIKLFNL